MSKIELNMKNDVLEKTKKPMLSKVCYVISAVLLVVAIYTTIINLIYVKNYALSYGVSIATMWKDFLSYVISGFVPNFAYAFIIFVLGKIVGKVFVSEPICAEIEEENIEWR